MNMAETFQADSKGKIEQLLNYQLDVGLHHGAQLSVYHGEDCIIDSACGSKPDTDEAIFNDDKFMLFSSTKPYVAVCIHLLAEQGALSYDDSIKKYWPEFAVTGSEKSNITIRHVLSHQAGMPVGPLDQRPDLWTDWNEVRTVMEEHDLMYLPGETVAYHSMNFGWILGELVYRIADTRIDEFARKEIFEPLGMEHTSIGLPANLVDDVVEIVGYDDFDRCRSPEFGIGDIDLTDSAEFFNQESVHRALIPAAGGIGTANDMAKFYACVSNGGSIGGTRILEPETVDSFTSLAVEAEEDQTLNIPRRYSLGFQLGGTPWDNFGSISPDGTFGHSGLGTVVGWADPSSGLSMSYLTNGMRQEYEHSTRAVVVSEGVRRILS